MPEKLIEKISEGLNLFDLIDVKAILTRNYERATSGDDAEDLRIALEMVRRVVERDRSRARKAKP